MATLVYMKQLWSWLYSRALLRIDSRCGHLKQLGVLLYSWPTDLLTDLCSGQLLLMCRAMLSHGQERKFQTRKGKGSLTTCISVVTPNRSEMKHYYGGATLQGGWRPFQAIVFQQLACWPSLQCSGKDVLSGRALHNRKVRHWKSQCQEDRYRRQEVRGDNEGYTRRNFQNLSYWLKGIQVLWGATLLYKLRYWDIV